MSYDLFNPSTQISRKLTNQSWAKTLELAHLYGWQPQGTQPPLFFDACVLNADWHGEYLTNDGQVVTAKDALMLAAALQKALNDIPDKKKPIDWNAELLVEDDLPDCLSPEEIDIIQDGLEAEYLDVMGTHPTEFFAGDEKHLLMMLVRFCRLGSFIIS